MLEQNIGLLLFYVSLCSHSGAALEPSKSRLIDATKPTRASRKEMPRGSSYVRRFCITPVPAEGGGLVNHTRREKGRGEARRGERAILFARVTRDPRFTSLREVFFFFLYFYMFHFSNVVLTTNASRITFYMIINQLLRIYNKRLLIFSKINRCKIIFQKLNF